MTYTGIFMFRASNDSDNNIEYKQGLEEFPVIFRRINWIKKFGISLCPIMMIY